MIYVIYFVVIMSHIDIKPYVTNTIERKRKTVSISLSVIVASNVISEN